MKKQYIAYIFLAVFVTTSQISVGTAFAATAVCTDLKTTLSLGQTSASVVKLQDFLSSQGYLSYSSTGYFGNLTFKAVQSFQKNQNLETVGFVGPKTRESIKKTSCAVAVAPAPVPAPQPAPVVVQQASVIQAVIPTQPKNSLPYRADSFLNWKHVWGGFSTTTQGALSVKASQSSTGGEAIFPDSKEWTDYNYTASVTVSNGSISLLARYTDEDNFLVCTFNGNDVSIQQRVGGKSTTVAAAKIEGMASGQYFQKSTSVSMSVKGNTVSCTAVGPGANVSFNNVDSKLANGGIGIQTWNPGNGAVLELRNVTVESI